MSFLAVIFFLFILLAVAVPVSIIQRIWRNFHNYGRSRSYSYGNPYSRHYSHSRPERKKKIFDKSEGEYVEFEEVASSSGTEHRTNVKYETEEQISDAEWTEIK